MQKPIAKKISFTLFSLFVFFILQVIPANGFSKGKNIRKSKFEVSTVSSAISVYDSLHLGAMGLSRQAYDYAMQGLDQLAPSGKVQNDKIISIVDFSLESTQKRLFVIDLANYKLLFNTYVAHGRNSGTNYATEFSNNPESNKSSLGFYTTESTYNGAHGYSLRIQGLEEGFNDNADERDIVIHAAGYVSENNIRKQGFLGRSLGCPALSPKLSVAVINKIKNGTCLFIYANDNNYISRSRLINGFFPGNV